MNDDHGTRFWCDFLRDAPRSLDFLADAPAKVGSERGSVELEVPYNLRRDLSRLAAESDAGTPVVLLAGIATFLEKLGAGRDISIGVPVAQAATARNGASRWDNLIVLRTRISGALTFREMVSRVRDTHEGAFAQRATPFESVVEAVGAGDVAEVHPLFQVGLEVHGDRPVPVTGVVENARTQCDLWFDFVESHPASSTELTGRLRFSSARLDTDAATTLFKRFIMFMGLVLHDADVSLARVEVTYPEERRKILREWNDTAREMPHRTWLEAFEEHVRAAPDARAVTSGSETLSYEELNARANHIAHYLIGKGVGPEDVVALAVRRSPDFIASFIGAQKAGAAYFPLDPTYPIERLRSMLRDVGPVAIICDRSHDHWELIDTAVVRLDQINFHRRPSIDPADSDRTTPLLPEHPAYVIYTSGSTGRPNGVVVPHSGLLNMARSKTERLGISDKSRVLQFASTSFDGSVQEMLTALTAGASIVLGSTDAWELGPVFFELLKSGAVTHATLPPSLLAALPDDVSAREGLTLLSAGEACSAQTVTRWGGSGRLFNGYGPTEGTVCSTMTGLLAGDTRPPIGRPIWNRHVYVLDSCLNIVPVGVPGELYIAGAGLARGYLNAPGLTAERFVPNPFGLPGSRMYRTGDKARWRENGELDYLGRVDQQVKIRGYRIEPAETEEVLLSHPNVAQAAVVVRDNRAGEKQLVAYVVPEGACSQRELTAHAENLLPGYLVPSAIVAVSEFPITANGKLDHGALPEPRPDRDPQGRPPGSATERLVCGLFAEVLGREALGVDDDFFSLGGESLGALRIVSRIQKERSVRIDLRTVFTTRTAAKLAAAIDGESRRLAAVSPARPGDREGLTAKEGKYNHDLG